MNRTFRMTVMAASMIPLFAGCSKIDFPATAQANTEQQATAVLARPAPDFTALVEKEGQAVVNITVMRSPQSSMMPQTQPQPQPQPQPGQPAPAPGPYGQPFPFPFPPFPQQPWQGGPEAEPARAAGSGFIISPDGYVVTNAHVVGSGGDVTVKLSDKREFSAKVIGSDPRTDIALLKIDAKNLPFVTIGKPGDVKVGEWVAAIGAPFGFENSISAGIVSAKGRSLPEGTYVPFIQTDVAVNPGNSGGPLFNLKGEVIGVNSQIYSRTGGYMGLSFAIPIDVAMDVTKQLQTEGKVTRGRIGVLIQELNQELAKSFGLPKASGALVSKVEKDSPAEKAGVQSGDVIVEFNGKPVEDSKDLPLLVGTTKPGSDAKVKVWRNGKPQELTIVIGDIKPEKLAAVPARGAGATSTDRLGLAVDDLTPQQREQLDVKGGVVVESAQGPAAKAGLNQGDVVLAINGESVTSAEQFADLVKNSPKDKPVALLVQRGQARLYVPVPVTAG